MDDKTKKRVEEIQRAASEAINRFAALPEAERHAAGQEFLEEIGLPMDRVMEAIHVVSGAQTAAYREGDVFGLFGANELLGEKVSGTQWEKAIYVNLMASPVGFLGFIVQAFLGGFLLGAGKLGSRVNPEVVKAANTTVDTTVAFGSFITAMNLGVSILRQEAKREAEEAVSTQSKLVH